MDETETESVPTTELVAPKPTATSAIKPAPGTEPWKNWRIEQDAIDWALVQLPEADLEELWQEFESLPTTNGKKAIAWFSAPSSTDQTTDPPNHEWEKSDRLGRASAADGLCTNHKQISSG